MVNWDGNVLIIMELQYGITNYGIHWQYGAAITHGGCENIVLDKGISDAI